MATSAKHSNSNNSFYFSPCSVRELVKNIFKKDNFKCLLNEAKHNDDYLNLIKISPGQIYTPNQQCLQLYGPNAMPMFNLFLFLRKFENLVNLNILYLRYGHKMDGESLFEDEMCANLWCTADGITTVTSFPAAPGSSCGNGKWCSVGQCVKNSKAPSGKCIFEDHFEFCENFLQRFGLRNVCLNFGNTRCCKMCGGKIIKSFESESLTNWISKASLNAVTWIEETLTPKCVDKYDWCDLFIKRMSTKFSDICHKHFLVNNEIVQLACRKSCFSCK